MTAASPIAFPAVSNCRLTSSDAESKKCCSSAVSCKRAEPRRAKAEWAMGSEHESAARSIAEAVAQANLAESTSYVSHGAGKNEQRS